MQIGAKRLAVAYTPIASTFLNAKRKLIRKQNEKYIQRTLVFPD